MDCFPCLPLKPFIATDRTVHFSAANMLVNISNAFDKPEETEERQQMKKLGGWTAV